MTLCHCPGAERLQEYVLGRLDLTSHEVLEGHLDDCPSCQGAVECLDVQTISSFARWRSVTPVAVDDAVLRGLTERARILCCPSVPPVLGHYVLHELLGSGGMGQVYKAEHQLMKRTVAVKVLAADLFRSEAARARFRREVELIARLQSPYVVTAHDAGHVDGRDFLVMEYVAGRNLADLVKQEGPLSVSEALHCIRQAAQGLQHAHAAGIVHRDVKPSNLLRDVHGTVKLLDLGLARVRLETDDSPHDLTASGTIMGTAAYLAPEQAIDTRRADARADVYSLGCTLFFLLTGKPPFDGATALQVLLAHRDKPLPSLRQLRPDCPPAVEALVLEMTAKRPDDRPADMQTVIAKLDSLPTAPVPRRRRGAGYLAIAGLGLAAALVLLGLFWPFTRHQPTSASPPDPNLVARGPEPLEPNPQSDPTPGSVAVPDDTASPEMVRIKPGDFWMGSPDTDRDADNSEKPRHEVTITRPFWLGKFELTQGEFVDLMERNPSQFAPDGPHKKQLEDIDTRRLPVESVSWLDAVQFCNRLSEKYKLEPYYSIEKEAVKVRGGTGYRLPTEAEWEYACRAGSETRWSFGADVRKLDDHAWHAGNSQRMPHPVGEKQPNPWGLYDMHGNVPEWVWDRFDADSYKKSTVNDPLGSGRGDTRVFRGGSWNDRALQTRSAARESLGIHYGVTSGVGFRVARDAEP